MKSFVRFLLLAGLILLPSFAEAGEGAPSRKPGRGLLVSMIQEPYVLSGCEEIARLIEHAKAGGIGTIYLQVYRANQSWFPSKAADDSPFQSGLRAVGEDPLALFLREAHQSGIKVFAWLNLLSLSKNEDAPLLKKYGPDILTRNLEPKKELRDYQIDNQYFLEPGDTRVREELAALVGELLEHYPQLDGILFDYIRYPDQHPRYGFTGMNVARFKKATGLGTVEEESPVWKDWKRRQVNEVLAMLVQKTRELRPDIQIAATGCMPYSRAHLEAYQDWPSWFREGLVGSVLIMSYTPQTPEFARYMIDAKKRVRDFGRVHVAVGAYALLKFPERFAEQMSVCEHSGPGSCVVFHYESLLENPDLENVLEP